MGYGYLAESCWRLNKMETAWTALDEAFKRVDNEERFFEAELYRLKGEMYLSQDEQDSAIKSFEHSIEVARDQQARSFELRSAVSLARLLKQQGDDDQAQTRLTTSLASFDTAPETADARDARDLLAG